MMIYNHAVFLILLLSFKSLSSFVLKIGNSHLSPGTVRYCRLNSCILYGKIAKKQEEEVQLQEGNNDDEMVSLPFTGIIGGGTDTLFKKPLEIYDPLKDTSDLPGEEGSDERINAMFARIEERVQKLKSTGEWNTSQYGDPLKDIPLWRTMIYHLQAANLGTIDELILTFILVLVALVTLATYTITLNASLNNVMNWYIKTDFDADFFSNIFH